MNLKGRRKSANLIFDGGLGTGFAPDWWVWAGRECTTDYDCELASAEFFKPLPSPGHTRPTSRGRLPRAPFIRVRHGGPIRRGRLMPPRQVRLRRGHAQARIWFTPGG